MYDDFLLISKAPLVFSACIGSYMRLHSLSDMTDFSNSVSSTDSSVTN